MSKKRITVDEIMEMHEEIIERYGGESGILNRGELEFIVDQVNYTRKSIFWKAAIILRGITCGHPFLDGNKRTALEAADTFLRIHGYRISANDREKIEFILDLAMHGKELDEIVEWLKKNTEKL
ncbi:type II toxin-antitoxin system death-on-curing family toxin [Archaeoglobales archaeon]|nr:MAG: type II toxin-antitoxin system death-on-curing family toxin [Archaeoglobales archaeon]